mmetsp:Transcript_16126/g.44655  ORF Transcript_16126/g.44655 Transcript_16126/m.44655 type:complete len:126 (-) Transcript_16126:416-793(-)
MCGTGENKHSIEGACDVGAMRVPYRCSMIDSMILVHSTDTRRILDERVQEEQPSRRVVGGADTMQRNVCVQLIGILVVFFTVEFCTILSWMQCSDAIQSQKKQLPEPSATLPCKSTTGRMPPLSR